MSETDPRIVTAEHRRAVMESLIEYARVTAGRNELIREAAAIMISKAEIARMTGLSRQHVHEILSGSQ